MSAILRTLGAAALATAAALEAERLPFRVFTAADGLAGDSVRELFEDSRGYLWIGTSSGLSRYGGQAFRNYDARDGLGGVRIDTVVETPDGRIWVGTPQGLARLRDQDAGSNLAFEGVPVPRTGLAGIGELYADRGGRLWVGTFSEMFVIAPQSAGAPQPAPEPFDLPSGWYPPRVAEDLRGNVWLASLGLLRLRGEERSPVFPVASGASAAQPVSALVFDRQGRLWLVHDSAVLVTWPNFEGPLSDTPLRDVARPPRFLGELPESSGDVIRYDAEHGLKNVLGMRPAVGRDGVWFSSHDGATHIGSGRLRTLNTPQGLPEANVMSVFEDRHGTVWFGSESRGLSRLRRSGITIYDVGDGLGGDRVSSLLEDADGALLVGTASRDLARLRDGRFSVVTPRALYQRGVLPGWGWNQYFLRDRIGRTWMPTAHGLFRYPVVSALERLRDAVPDRAFTDALGNQGRDVFRLYEDRAGDIWVSLIAQRPLQRMVGGERLEIEPEIEGPNHGGAPTAFAEDRAGGLWMGFYLGGLGRRDSGGWRFFGPEHGIPPGFVTDLHLDRAGRLWVSTVAGGVARLDDPASARPAVRRYRVQEGLTTDSTRCLAEAPDGAMYIGHSRGLDRLDVATGEVRSFSVDDGLPNNFVLTCMAAGDGALWFGTMHGLVRLEPAAEAEREPPALLITAIRVAGTALVLPALGTSSLAGIELPPERNALEIDVEALGLAQDSRVRVQHRLAGRDAPWSEPALARTLSFPHLAPGRYRLEMRAVARDGRPGPAATVAFRLQAPLVDRTWVRALAAGLLATAVFGVYRLRVARLLAVERARTRIASDLHDDVGSGLSRIGVLSEMARSRLPEEPEATLGLLEQLGEETAALAENASEIIWSVDPHKDDFESVVVRLRRFAADLLEARGMVLRFTAPDGAAQVELRPEVRRAVYLVLKEAIHNAARHSGAAAVEVSIALRDGAIEGEVRDDGGGIETARAAEAERDGHRGLPGMQRRAEAVGGVLTLDAPPGAGTRVRLRVPLRGGRLSHADARRRSATGDTTSSA